MMAFTLQRHAGHALWTLLLLALAAAGPATAFHFPWDQGHDTTDWVDPDDPGDNDDNCDPCNANSTGSPVILHTGGFTWQSVDVDLKGTPQLALTRTYFSQDPMPGPFGNGWSTSLDRALVPVLSDATGSSPSAYVFKSANGNRYTYQVHDDGTIERPAGIRRELSVREDGLTRLDYPKGKGYELYDAAGKLVQQVDRNGNVTEYDYFPNGTLERIRDLNGRFLALTYSATGRVSTVTDHTARVWQYDYDTNGNLIAVTDPLGGVTRYAYFFFFYPGDAQPRYPLISITDQAGVVRTTVTYALDRVIRYTEGANTYTFSYGNDNTVTKTDSAGSSWVFTLDDEGLVLQVVDPVGMLTTREFDDDGLVTRVVEDGYENLFTYDDEGRLLTQSNDRGTTTFTYTGDGEGPATTTSRLGRVSTFAYDSAGNLREIDDPAGASTVLGVDPRGFVTTVQDALGAVSTTEYDAAGYSTAHIAPLGQRTEHVLDALGNVLSTTNALGQTDTYTYDALDRLASHTDPLGNVTRYAYDAAGRLTRITAPNDAFYTYLYDQHGRLIERTEYNGASYSYTYNADNTLSTALTPDGLTYRYTYDAAKRVLSETRGTDVTTYRYDVRGKMLEASNEASTITFAYDAAGRLITETIDGTVISRAYNGEDEMVAMSYLGADYAYAYDARGQVSGISRDGVTEFSFAFDPAGRTDTLQRSNGVNTAMSYSANNWTLAIDHQGLAGGTLDYGLNDLGIVTGWDGLGSAVDYAYDADNRLLSQTRDGTPATFTYDEMGNLTVDGAVYDDAGQLVETAALIFEYDARGNRTREASKSDDSEVDYTYDAENELTAVQVTLDTGSELLTTTIAYAYDAFGRRVSKTVDGATTRFIWSEEQLIGQVNPDGSTQAYLTDPNTLTVLARYDDGAGLAHYYHRDHLGTPLAITDAAGALVWSAEYAAYGEALVSGTTENPIRFPGHYYDGETGLHYNRHRVYDPATGLYLQVDPVGVQGGINVYQYAYANPVLYVDRSGETPWGLIFGGADLAWQLYQNGGNLSCVDWTQVGLSMIGGGLLNGLLKGAFRAKTFGSHTWGATRSWMNRRGIMNIRPGQQRHHWLFERNQGIGRYVPDSIKNQPWNINPISSGFNNWLGRNPWRAPLGGPSWAGELLGGAGLAGLGGTGDDCECNK